MPREVTPWSYENIVKGYSGAKRSVYERAMKNLQSGFEKRWAVVRMFVKPDKHPLNEIFTKAPRAIQYRRPEFNLSLAKYLKPLEEVVYAVRDPITNLRYFAKGRNLQERAADIIEHYEYFNDCIVLEADHAKFDSCVRVEHLKRIHNFYRKFFKSHTLRQLLRYQFRNKGFSSRGLRYRVKGTRMSGDFDTALGNSLLNFMVLCQALENCGLKKGEYSIYIDGDDSLIFMSRTNKIKLLSFTEFGFETKWDVKDLITAEFCKGHVIRCDPPILVRDPIRILSNLNVCLKSFDDTTWPELWYGKLVCEFWANQGVPYLHKYFATLASKAPVNYRIPVEDERRWSQVKNHKLGKVTPQAIEDFHVAFGLDCSLIFTPTASGTPDIIRQTKFKNKLKYVCSSSSLQRTWEGFSRMDCSPSLCGRAGGQCGCAVSVETCNATPLRIPGAPNGRRSVPAC